MNYNNILKEVEQKIIDASSAGDPDKLLSWFKVLKEMKSCGLVQINMNYKMIKFNNQIKENS